MLNFEKLNQWHKREQAKLLPMEVQHEFQCKIIKILKNSLQRNVQSC